MVPNQEMMRQLSGFGQRISDVNKEYRLYRKMCLIPKRFVREGVECDLHVSEQGCLERSMRSFFQDLQYGVRQLRNAPVFALTAILTLALGIGVNAAMFSVVDQVLLRAMPFPRADEVVQMAAQTESGSFAPTSLPDIRDWQARSHSFSKIAYFTEQVPTLGGTDNRKLVPQVLSSANLFEMLEARPMMGRIFVPADGEAGHTMVVVLSAKLWRGVL